MHELRANLTAAAAATARAQQQADIAHADVAKLQTQLHNRTNSPAIEAELQELRSQLRSAQTLAAQQQQEAMLSRGGSWGYDGADLGIDHGGSTPRLMSPRPSFNARQGPGSSRRGSGGSPLNPRLSMTGMQVCYLNQISMIVSEACCLGLAQQLHFFLASSCMEMTQQACCTNAVTHSRVAFCICSICGLC